MILMTLRLLRLKYCAVAVVDDSGQGSAASGGGGGGDDDDDVDDDDYDDDAGDRQRNTPRIILYRTMVANSTTPTTEALSQLVASLVPKVHNEPQVSATHKTAPGALPYLVFRPQGGFRFEFLSAGFQSAWQHGLQFRCCLH